MRTKPGYALSILLMVILIGGCGTSPLKKAVVAGDHRQIERLLDQGEDPNWQWEGGLLTAYGEAASRGDLRAIELFWEAGFSPHGSLVPEALKNGHADIIPFLTAYGADVNAVVSGPFTLSQKYYTSLMPALGYAVIDNDLDSVKLLLELGAKTHFRATSSYPGYFSALHMASERGHTSIAKHLASNTSDLNLLVYEKSPIALAAEHGHYETVVELAKLGAFIAYDPEHPQPIELALDNGHDSIVEFLESKGVPRPERVDYAELLANVAETAITVAVITAGVAIAVEAAKHSASSPAIYTPPLSTSKQEKPTQQKASSWTPPRAASEPSVCASDYSCGIGYSCVKRPYRSTGVCMKTVDSYGTRTFDMPSSESIGPNNNPQCYLDSDCPAGFQCDSKYQACVAR
ncbi:MAG: hypothetical protein CME38_09360 [Haliea sp.]|nr:hypothetical protein [Haliea sp.]|tara:strand:+ start:4780 stop:5991 length:1212 start_codon:yes stop_codon:yes gene_type:complete